MRPVAGDQFLRQGRAERRVQPAPDHRVGEIQHRHHDAGEDRGREEIGHRDLENRAHDHQHDRGRDEDAQRAAGGDRSGGEADIVARTVHRGCRHDAENGDAGADDSGCGAKYHADEQDGDEERSLHPRQHELHGREQALHQPGLFHHESHEHEQRHRRERLLHHRAVDLERHQENGELDADAPGPEDETEEDEREGYREPHEDREQHRSDHQEPDYFVGNLEH